MSVALTGNDLTFAQLDAVVFNGAEVALASHARASMEASRAVIERLVASNTTVYGVNTGFGELSEVRISPDQIRELQLNLVRSHACGVGAPLSEAETRGVMLLRANALAKGLSGVRPVVVETLCAMLNRRVHPVIPSQGSVGASGDLAAALSLDALRGSPAAFDERIARARPYPGAATTARNLTRLNRGSQIRESHRSAERDPRVQDAYSLRCAPQVHGAVRDAITQVRATAALELNSATDNPLVFVDAQGGEVISGGNFHGQPLAMAADQLAVGLATLAAVSERRIEQMTNPSPSLLPAFLTAEPGLNSGFMLAQVTAAALASENKMLSVALSVDSIPTSGNQEDYVSMGMSATRRLRPMLDNLRNILAIELLAACQGIDLLAPLRTGAEAQKAYEIVRSGSPRVNADRALASDIGAIAHVISEAAFQKLLN